MDIVGAINAVNLDHNKSFTSNGGAAIFWHRTLNEVYIYNGLDVEYILFSDKWTEDS